MTPDFRAKLDSANSIPAEPLATWNERYRESLKRVGLRIEAAGREGFPTGPLAAPKCVPGKAFGWPADSVIVEVSK